MRRRSLSILLHKTKMWRGRGWVKIGVTMVIKSGRGTTSWRGENKRERRMGAERVGWQPMIFLNPSFLICGPSILRWKIIWRDQWCCEGVNFLRLVDLRNSFYSFAVSRMETNTRFSMTKKIKLYMIRLLKKCLIYIYY